MAFELILLDVDGVIRDISRLLYECHRRGFSEFYDSSEFTSLFTVESLWRLKGIGKYNFRPESVKAVKAMIDSSKHVDVEAILSRLDAEKAIDGIVKANSAPGQRKEMDKINRVYIKTFMARESRTLASIYPGVTRAIGMLKKSGKKVGIVTNSYRHTLRRDVPASILGRLDVLITHETIVRPKPSGYGLRKAARALGVDMGEVAYVGDTVVDVRAAKAAGCASMSVLCGMGVERHLIHEGTDATFKDLLSAAEFLSGR